MADYAYTVLEITPETLERLGESIGSRIIIPTDERGISFLNRCNLGEIINLDTRRVDKGLLRSHKQLNMYWAACTMVSDNTDNYYWNTSEKTDLQCKIAAKLIRGFVTYQDENGKEQIQLIPGSIAFKNLEHLKACSFFDYAFRAMAEHLKIDTETLRIETQKRMMGGNF